jgi:hypothetical protein
MMIPFPWKENIDWKTDLTAFKELGRQHPVG